MKKILYTLLALPILLSSCEEEMGTKSGSDKTPNVVLYTYEPADETLNPDNDVTVRFATNGATKAVYYIVEDAESFEASSTDENAWIAKVLDTGAKIDVDGAENVDVDVTGLVGLKYILAVATDGAKTKFSKITFRGLVWETVTTGAFSYGSGLTFLPIRGTESALEVCESDPMLYRIKDAFGEGSHLKLNVIPGSNDEDEDGEYVLVRIAEQKTPFSVKFTDGTVSAVTVKDVGYWQDKPSYVTEETGYHNVLYLSDGYCVINLAWMTSKGTVAYGKWDSNACVFIPD